MKTTKNIPFNKNQVIVNKDTFDTMEKIVKESKKVMELQPKINQVFKEVDSYANSFNSLEKENRQYKNEIDSLKKNNNKLIEKNNSLKTQIKAILKAINQFFRKLLQIGNEPTKEAITNEVKDYYDYQDFGMEDVKDIAKGTTKEDELFEYANVPDYYKSNYSPYDDYDNEDSKGNDFEISL